MKVGTRVKFIDPRTGVRREGVFAADKGSTIVVTDMLGRPWEVPRTSVEFPN